MNIGVDACPLGWVRADYDAELGKVRWSAHRQFNALFEGEKNVGEVWIDIPIGLPSIQKPSRSCDQWLRHFLKGSRKSSVFSPPSRELIEIEGYEEARKKSRFYTGKAFSIQSWNLRKKIAEVEGFLMGYNPNNPSPVVLRESLPELAFQAMNSGVPLKFAKRKPEGLIEREQILKQWVEGISELKAELRAAYRAADVGYDDLWDAVALAVVQNPHFFEIRRYPTPPEKDARGIVMQVSIAFSKQP